MSIYKKQYMYTACVFKSLSLYIYTYNIHVYIYTHIYIYICVYVYVYMCTVFAMYSSCSAMFCCISGLVSQP